MYVWVKHQRKQWKSFKKGEYSSLTPARLKLLDSIDFKGDARSHFAPRGSRKAEKLARQAAKHAVQKATEELDSHNRLDESGDEEENAVV